MTVPNAWNAGDNSDASFAGGVGWYRKDFRFPSNNRNLSWVVRFESVNYRSKAWLNGKPWLKGRVSCIYNGVDLSRFDAPADPDGFRRELGVPPGTPLVGVVSRLTRMKGLEQFLQSAPRVQPPMNWGNLIVIEHFLLFFLGLCLLLSLLFGFDPRRLTKQGPKEVSTSGTF